MKLLAFLALLAFPLLASAAVPAGGMPSFPPPLESYGDDGVAGIAGKLLGRVAGEPFNAVGTLIFVLAIVHTFLCAKFMKVSHAFEERWEAADPAQARVRDRLRFNAALFHFLGEVEAVFGIWAIPLAIAIIGFYGWTTMVHYIDGISYTEPLFVFVVMAIAGSRPVLRFAEACLAVCARAGGQTPAAWWLAILTVGPLLGSFITEAAAMTICALLLLKKFYALKPGMTLRYATLGLLFVNISVGGTLSHFAAPPVVMVSAKWHWGTWFMLTNFGWKAAVGIVVANALFFLRFRKELTSLRGSGAETAEEPVPLPITAVHLLAIAWTVVNAHYPALVIIGLLFFLAFVVATERHQDTVALRSPMLVGFFLASLLIHGGCQQWWIAPVLGGLGRWPLMIGSTILTMFNDNAAITYLATLVPGFTEPLKYAVMAGAVTGGGLTVIANAPNPAGQSLLQSQFGDGGVNPFGLFLAALAPTVIVGAAFMLLP